MTAYTPNSRYRIGKLGESLALRIFTSLGADSRYGKPGESDLVINQVQVEIKTAQQGKDSKWRFTLWKQGSQNHRISQFVLLCAIHALGETWFFIPTCDIWEKHHAVITSHPETYTGKLSRYKVKSFSEILVHLT